MFRPNATGIAQLATKADFADLKGQPDGLEGRLDGLKGRLDVLLWVVGIQSAVVLAIALRVFGVV